MVRQPMICDYSARVVQSVFCYSIFHSFVSIKTSFNYCSSGSGQNSIIPVVCDVPE